MLTHEQKETIVKMYKSETPLKQIGLELGIPIPTVASYIRRNHPQLQRWNTYKRKERIAKIEKNISQQLNISSSTSNAIFAIVLEKFENKRKNAIKLGVEFTVQLSDLDIPKVCPYLGTKLDYYAHHRADNAITFDRIDNTKGYVKGNVVICSWRANRIKSDGLAEEHERIAAFMKQHA